MVNPHHQIRYCLVYHRFNFTVTRGYAHPFATKSIILLSQYHCALLKTHVTSAATVLDTGILR